MSRTIIGSRCAILSVILAFLLIASSPPPARGQSADEAALRSLTQQFFEAFGKQDLDGALVAWQQVIELSPNSPEGQAARQALDSMRSAHPAPGTGQKPGA